MDWLKELLKKAGIEEEKVDGVIEKALTAAKAKNPKTCMER